MTMNSSCDTPKGGFPHSEISGSKLICQLPEAYRRLSRPSSPIIAKASTTCTYSLDPITLLPRCPGATATKVAAAHGNRITLALVRPIRSPGQDTMQYITQFALVHSQRATAPRPRLRELTFTFIPDCQRASESWWVWMDSNHRPPPYQDGA